MNKTECTRMQSLSRTEVEAVLYECFVGAATFATQYLHSAIALVSKQRMTDMAHVGTYLMSAASLEDTLHECHISETLYHAVVGDSLFAYARIR